MECGCQAERQKHLDLPRGSVDVDVYARDATREPVLTIVCECKQWSTAVPKQVVHAFRTVVDEVGANIGFIISAHGFQRGAIQAAENTCVHLVTWEEFQARFFDRWFAAMRVKLAARADEVFEYSDYFHRRTTSVLHGIPARVEELSSLHHRFSAYITVTSYSRILQLEPMTFPAQMVDPRATEITTIEVKDARTYFDLLLSAADQAIAAYEAFIAKYEALDAAGHDD